VYPKRRRKFLDVVNQYFIAIFNMYFVSVNACALTLT